MDGNGYIQGQLATIAWIDGLESGLNGMHAVAWVVRNRVIAGWRSGDWVANIWALYRERSREWGEPPDVRDPSFLSLLQSVDLIYKGDAVDKLSNGALYYDCLNHAAIRTPEHYGRTYTFLAKIGTLTLYK